MSEHKRIYWESVLRNCYLGGTALALLLGILFAYYGLVELKRDQLGLFEAVESLSSRIAALEEASHGK